MKTSKPRWLQEILIEDTSQLHSFLTKLLVILLNRRSNKDTIYIVMPSQETPPESKWLQKSLIEHTSDLNSSLNQTACGTIEYWCLTLRSNKQTYLSNTIHVVSHQETPNSKWLQESLIEHAPQLHSSSNRLLLPAARARCLGVPSESSGARPPPRAPNARRASPQAVELGGASGGALARQVKTRQFSRRASFTDSRGTP